MRVRVLAVSSANGGADAAILEAGQMLAGGRIEEDRGLAGALPTLIERLLECAGRGLDLVSVVVGPGSFTGLRAGIAVSSGVALGLGIPVVGVTVAEALAEALADLDGRTLWTAIEARRGRLFLDTGRGPVGIWTNALPSASGRIALCGNAANQVAAGLAARGVDVMLTAARRALPSSVASVGLQRAGGKRPALAAVPLYVDPPEARLPAGGLRGAPV